MITKLKSLDKSDDNAMFDAVCNSAHQIWQAGLGAFAKAREEGEEMFEKLVREGADLQKRTQQLAVEKGFALPGTATRMAENVSKQAFGSLEKLEKVFEDRVSRSLRGMGVPTQEDIKALSRQLDELKQLITQMPERKKATRRTAANAAPKAVAKAAAKAVPKAVPKAAAKSTTLKGNARVAAKKPSRTAARAV